MRYAEYYSHVSPWNSKDAQVLDISLGELVLGCNGKRYGICLDPPMTDWREARERMVRMDREAVAGLGRSDITVREYPAPKGFHAVVFLACLATFLILSTRRNLLPGSLLYQYLLRYVPSFATFLYKIQPLVLYPMLAIHSFEAFYMETARLNKHSVPRLSRLWWTWLVSTFIEGYGAFQRFDRIVKGKKAENEKQKQ